jgi:microcin C transport system permease protein
MGIIKNPVTRKRLARFAENRRAYYSFWILLLLFCLSLIAELLSNGTPLYIRFEGKSYFPLVKYYSEGVFLEDGRETRPNYKRLQREAPFAQDSGNYMLFPPHPYGPYETIQADTIALDNEVTLQFMPVLRIGTVDITPELDVVRSNFFDFFAGDDVDTTQPLNIAEQFDLPGRLIQEIQKRFDNRGAPYEAFRMSHGSIEFEVALSTYTPRDKPPETLRLIFREFPGSGRDGQVKAVFDEVLEPVDPLPALWNEIDEADQRLLESLVLQRFEGPVDDQRVIAGDRQYLVTFVKTDLRFPFPPVAGHPMGIDGAGRDVLARIIYGLRISLTFGFLLVGCSMTLGILTGSLQGYYGGKIDITAQRMIEIWSALPFLYVMILMGSIYGRSFMLLLIIYGLFNWIGISYYIRAEFLNLRSRPFVEAATCMGIPARKIIFKHILPNAMVPVITFFPFSLVGAIGALAALDYLGFGLPPPTPSWGELLFQAQQYRWAWWLILYPSLALFIVMLLGVFIGEGVRNAYDPKRYSRLE